MSLSRPPFPSFVSSIRGYERFLATVLDTVWGADLQEKHRRMQDSPFVFLRATYWRWAETILWLCPDVADAPAVTAVGDVHLENYGLWRDLDGRLVWGVNDLDEAAEMPFALDLIRLGTSAVLSPHLRHFSRGALCDSLLDGYRRGLESPRPFTLDEEHGWLRQAFEATGRERRRFWKRIQSLGGDSGVPAKYRKALNDAMPGRDATVHRFARRRAGVGSLGRPRWVGVATWRGSDVVREAKARVSSAWTLVHPQRAMNRTAEAILAGPFRAPDPWYRLTPTVVTRRLSPNARRIELEDAPELVSPQLLDAMGHELANIHRGSRRGGTILLRDLERRPHAWLRRAVDTAAHFVSGEFRAFANR